MTLRIESPGSKSMTQRALILSALARAPGQLEGALICDDSSFMTDVLEALGATVEWSGTDVRVAPAPLRGRGSRLYCGNAGTVVRFCSCLGLVSDGGFTIDGDRHMRGRPIGPLTGALEQLGASVSFELEHGYPPLRIEPPEAGEAGSTVTVDGSLSSQYASGLLMVAPHLPDGISLTLTGTPVSRPYLDMTLEMMKGAGARLQWASPGTLRVEPGPYEGRRWSIEPDWSTAAFLLAAGNIAGKSVEVPGLLPPDESLQGDATFSVLLDRLRRGEDREFDLTDVPDLIAPLAAAAVFARGRTRIRGVAHARVKESDRVSVLARGLGQVGVEVRETDDGLDIEPLGTVVPVAATLDPEDDHRMAMAFGLLSLRQPGIVVDNPGCVSKSFPGFWEALERFRE